MLASEKEYFSHFSPRSVDMSSKNEESINDCKVNSKLTQSSAYLNIPSPGTSQKVVSATMEGGIVLL